MRDRVAMPFFADAISLTGALDVVCRSSRGVEKHDGRSEVVKNADWYVPSVIQYRFARPGRRSSLAR